MMLSPQNTLVLVEVRSSKKANPFLRQSVNYLKMHHLQQTMDVFLLKHSQYRSYPRCIEVVWIEGDKIESVVLQT